MKSLMPVLLALASCKSFYPDSPEVAGPFDLPGADAAATDDPLAVAGGDVDTSYPCLKPGPYRMTIAECERIPVKETADLPDEDKRWQIRIKLTTNENHMSTNNEELPAGFAVTTYVSLSETPADPAAGKKAFTMQDVRKGIAKVIQAAYGAKTTVPLTTLRDTPEELKGKVVDVKIGLSKPSDNYPDPSNQVKSWIPASV